MENPQSMKVSYWGVRGSIPCPGPDTIRYGGDTSCISVEVDNCILVLDAGTGIRRLGNAIASTDKEIYCLISHLHLDHIRGFPFFEPLFQVDRKITLIPYQKEDSFWYATSLMDEVQFPRNWKTLPSNIVLANETADSFFSEFSFDVETFEVKHPGGAVGFIVTTESGSFANVPDNEIDASSDTYELLKQTLNGVSVLSHDGQWTRDEFPRKRGWGHSSVEDLCDFAVDLNVNKLVIFHHAPDRTDDELDVIGREASKRLLANGIECEVAYEGLSFNC